MKFSELAVYLKKLEDTTSRNDMTQILSELFKSLHADEIDKVLYLMQGSVAPMYEKVDFGIAEKLMLNAIERALQLDPAELRRKNRTLGDIGLTVQHFKHEYTSMYEQDVSITKVFDILKKVTHVSGMGSQDEKLALLGELIQTSDALSARYIVRIPLNKLRLGFSDMTILDSLSWMIGGDKSLRGQIEAAYQVRPDIGYIGKLIKQKGMSALSRVVPAVFTPILMMRAERLSDVNKIMEKAPGGIIEPKYDGFRLQIHARKTKTRENENIEIKLYSRNLEDVTYMYPDIVTGIQKEIHADSFICEGEAIGYHGATGGFLPFQETVQRRRKYNIEAKTIEIPLKLFVFELLYVDGRMYLNEPFETRRRTLEKLINISGNIEKDTILVAPEKVAIDTKAIELEFETAVTAGLEGIMIKKRDGVYKPGARGYNWIKYKRSYAGHIEDTIDCLVMGYDKGQGKRANFGIGAILVGVYDEKHDLYKTVAKIGTGLTDEEWRTIKKQADAVKTNTKPPLYDVDKLVNPDVWCEPEIVLEIRADEITRSPAHTAGRVMKATKTGKGTEVEVAGYALRFPRLERFRDDKRPQDVTTVSEMEHLYRAQTRQ